MKKIIIFNILILLIFLTGCKELAITPSECSGSIDLDINRIERIPGSPIFKVTATANRAGDCLKIAWTKDDIDYYLKQSSPEEISEKGVYGDIILNSQTEILYTGEDPALKVNNYNLFEVGYTWRACSVDNCRNIWGYPTTEYTVRAVAWPGPCYCIYTTPWGVFAPISGTKSRSTKATISVSGLYPKIITAGVDGEQSVNLDNKITAIWRGDLVGGYWQGTPGSPYLPFNDNGILRLTTTNAFQIKEVDIYIDGKRYDNIKSCLEAGSGLEWSKSQALKCISSYKTQTTNLLLDKTSNFVAGTRGVVKSAKFIGSDFVMDIEPYSTSFPQFTMIIDAAWVGVHFVLGQPKVSCPSSQEEDSGKTRKVYFTVTNIDKEERGVFGLTLNCDKSSTGLTITRITLEPGASQQIEGYITGSAITQKESDNCEFKAYVVKQPSRFDKCDFAFTINPVVTCIPGEKTCSPDMSKLGICNADGKTWNWQTCSYGCEFVPEGAKCRGQQCMSEGEICAEDKDCCKELICKDNKCAKILPECGTCFHWLYGKIQKDFCSPSSPKKILWIIPIKITSQDNVCPLWLILFFGIILIIVAVVIKTFIINKRKE